MHPGGETDIHPENGLGTSNDQSNQPWIDRIFAAPETQDHFKRPIT